MKAVQYNFNVPTYLAAKSFGKYLPSLYDGKFSALSLEEIKEPTLPNDNWIKVKSLYSGVCGSDLGAIFYKTSPVMTPFNSFPSVLGHEVVGLVTEVGKNVSNVKVGERIAVDPYIGCEVREHTPLCPACAKGMHSLCRNTGGTEKLGPSMILGFSADFPGTWSEKFVIHQSMAIQIPEAISDRVAALTEPLSVGLHAVLRNLPAEKANVLVIGGGMISYAVIAAIKLLKLDCNITHLSLLPYQQELAISLGAHQAFNHQNDVENFLLSFPETKKHKPTIGKDVYRGGFDIIYDCIGSDMTIDQSLNYAKERGKITLVGCASKLKNLDLTFLWANELQLVGTHAYAKKEIWNNQELSTQQLLLQLIEQQPDYPLEKLISHEYALSEYREAIHANIHRAETESMKTLFKFT